MGRRVLVLRPEPGASATAKALRRMGHEPAVLPLTEIRPLSPAFAPSPESPAAFDAVIVTSANAVRHAPPELLAHLAGLRVFAVGGATGEIARAAGFAKVEIAAGDGISLARLVHERLPTGSRVLYLCGRVRRPEFESAMDLAHIRVEAVEIYDTIVIPIAREQVAAIAARDIDVVLVHSTESALALVRLAELYGAPSTMAQACCVAISQRAAEPVRIARLCREVVVAREPSEEAILSAIATL